MRSSVLSIFGWASILQFIDPIQAQGAANWTIGQTVQTSSGPVSGHKASNTTVSEYLGIPFAKPPVGELRWTAPVKYTGSAPLNGSVYGFSCPSNSAVSGASNSPANIANANITAAGIQILSSLGQAGDVYGEDCLVLNVWTKPQVGEAKKAVLVWIYGGGFNTGSSRGPVYNGQFFAEGEDVVIVSLNYRVNIFGFPGSPQTTQNLGLLDQRLAIEWVRENIAAFGGDPARIILFGQSAGGASVDYHVFGWPSDPIAAGYIPQSGTAVSFRQTPPSVAAQSWFYTTAKLNCGNATSPGAEVLKCMRTKDYASILAAFPESTEGTGAGAFGPTIDEKVVFSNYLERSRTGNFTKRPLLLGNTDYEGGLYQTTAALAGAPRPREYWTLFSNIAFNCPTATRANISITHNIPTWRYRYFGVFPNTRLTSSPESGAWHASELAVLFNNTAKRGGSPPDTVEEIAIGNYMRGAWAAFAKDPVAGLRRYDGGWPLYRLGEKTLVRLAYENKTGVNVALGVEYDTACNLTFAVNATGAGNVTRTPNGTVTGTGPAATGSRTAGAERLTMSVLLVLGAVGFAVLI